MSELSGIPDVPAGCLKKISFMNFAHLSFERILVILDFMESMQPGKALMALGLSIFIVGLFWAYGPKGFPLGRLPGDFSVERPGFKFYFPLTTSIILSVVLSLVLYVLRRFGKG